MMKKKNHKKSLLDSEQGKKTKQLSKHWKCSHVPLEPSQEYVQNKNAEFQDLRVCAWPCEEICKPDHIRV